MLRSSNSFSELVFVRRPFAKPRGNAPKTFSHVHKARIASIHNMTIDDFYDQNNHYTLSLRLENPLNNTPFDLSLFEGKRLVTWAKSVHDHQREPTFIFTSTGLLSLAMMIDRVDVYVVVNDVRYEWCSFIYPTVQMHSQYGAAELEISSLFFYTTPNFWSQQNNTPLRVIHTFPEPNSKQFAAITFRQARTARDSDVLDGIVSWYRNHPEDKGETDEHQRSEQQFNMYANIPLFES